MRIFLVEDEVQSYIVAMLEKADHVVVTEANGTKALRRYSKEGPFDLVLTDIEHKGMNGIDLMHAIHKKNRKQSVGIITGWPVLQKPFRQKELLKFIKQLEPQR
jgi:two-component system C4-dicarboxylate transport response regulator DctD